MLYSKVAAVMELAKETKISRKSQKKIMEVLTYNSSVMGALWSNKTSIFYELPKQLQYEVALMMYGGIADRLPFFKGKEASFVVYVMPLMRPLQLDDREFLYKEQDFATEMAIIVKGRVNCVLSISDIEYKSFLKGSYFGEAEILLEMYRLCNVQSSGVTDLMTISKQSLLKIVEDFPNIGKELIKVAREKATRIMKCKAQFAALFRLKAQIGSLNSLAGTKFEEITLDEPSLPPLQDEIVTRIRSGMQKTKGEVSEMHCHFDGIEEKMEQLEEFIRASQR